MKLNFAPVALFVLVLGCSAATGDPDPNASGGSLANGGSGGLSSNTSSGVSGATNSSAGAPLGSGGKAAIGGATSGGATTSSGGTKATGGTGVSSVGGSSNQGGSSNRGGASSQGGSGQGGATNRGGASSQGGAATGGAAAGGASPTCNAAATGSTPVARHGALKVVGAKLVDASGCAVQLKGPSSMWLNWESQPFAEDKQGLQFMRDDWRASVVRAAMGVDTPTDTKDKEYLVDPAAASGKVNTIVQNAIDLGMYVIIDWHDHAADTHQAQAIKFFTEMATKWGSYPNVLYETFNEPTTQAWATVIKPYHEAVVAAIRAIDPDNVILLGSRTYSQRVDEAAASPVSGVNLMYSLHFYSCTHTATLRNRAAAAVTQGLPIFVTEWGATHADGGTRTNPGTCLPEAQLWHDWMNQNKISWAAWKWDRCVDTSCYFKSTMTIPTNGGWTDDMLNGHTPFLRDRMRE